MWVIVEINKQLKQIPEYLADFYLFNDAGSTFLCVIACCAVLKACQTHLTLPPSGNTSETKPGNTNIFYNKII